MLDAYELHKEETGIMEAKEMTLRMVIQRLTILKETIEKRILGKGNHKQIKTPMQKTKKVIFFS